MKILPIVSFVVLIPPAACAAGGGRTSPSPTRPAAGVPSPAGICVLDDAGNEKSTAGLYAAGLLTSAASRNDVTGHAETVFIDACHVTEEGNDMLAESLLPILRSGF